MSQMDLAGLRMDLRMLEKAVNELTRRVDALDRELRLPVVDLVSGISLEPRPFMPTAEDFRALMAKDDDGA